MNKPILKILIGVSGSGKSTWAAETLKANRDYFIDTEYFNRDELRIYSLYRMRVHKPYTLKTYYSNKISNATRANCENVYTRAGEQSIIDFAKNCHKSMFSYNLFIFDTTMLKPEYLERVLKVADDKYEVTLVLFKLPNKWLLRWRLFWRDGTTDFRYLDKQIEDYHKMVEYINTIHSDKLLHKINF